MSLTTMVPFIKPGIPRLKLFDVKEGRTSKSNFKGKDKLFSDNLTIREGILKYNQEAKIKNFRQKNSEQKWNATIFDKSEAMNISNNPELKIEWKDKEITAIDIDSDLKKSIIEIETPKNRKIYSGNINERNKGKHLISEIQPYGDHVNYNPYKLKHLKANRMAKSRRYRTNNNRSHVTYQKR